MRRVILAIGGLILCLGAYGLYRVWFGSGDVLYQPSASREPLALPTPSSRSVSTAPTVHSAQQSLYIVRDPETKKVKQVFGFDKLLNPQAQQTRWTVEKPYMIFYQSQSVWRVDAQQGQFQIERTAGGIIPKDAQLEGEVTIRSVPAEGSSMPEAVMRLERLLFSSERSEFTTDGIVELHARQAYLKGTGLILLLNTYTGQVEYLRLLALDVLRLKSQRSARSMERNEQEGGEQQTLPDATMDQSDQEGKNRWYRAVFDRDVVIRVGQQLIATAQKDAEILNIPLGSRGQKEVKEQPVGMQTAVVQDERTIGFNLRDIPEVRFEFDSAQDIEIRCAGGIVLETAGQKSIAAKAEQAANVLNHRRYVGRVEPMRWPLALASIAVANVADGQTQQASGTYMSTVEPLDTPPAQFQAVSFVYDYQTGVGQAKGPIRLIFYQPSGAQSGLVKPYWPMEMTADGDVQFLPNSDRQIRTAIFFGDVYGQRVLTYPAYEQRDAFNGQRLTVHFDQVGGKTHISQLVLTEGDVFAESRRVAGSMKLAHIRLSCMQIEYYREGRLIAVGPGQIEVDNSKADRLADGMSRDDSLLEKPSYAYLRGFERLEWLPTDQQLLAQTGNAQLELMYIPLKEDGQPEKLLSAAAGRAELHFSQRADGRLRLANIQADERIYFEERGRLLLEGSRLVYDAQQNGWLSIIGDQHRPCIVNGARVPYIHYHLPSGQLETKLATAPSTVPVRQ